MRRQYLITELIGFNNIPWEKAYLCTITESYYTLYRSILIMGDINELLYTEQYANIPSDCVTTKAWVNRVQECLELSR